jgi:hypothetical protein
MEKQNLPEGWKFDGMLGWLCTFVLHGRDAPQGMRTENKG